MSDTLSQVNIQMTADTVQYIRSLQQAQANTNKELKKIGNQFNSVQDKVNKAGKGIAAAVAAAFTIGGMTEFMNAQVAMQREIKRSADTANMTVKEFKAMAYAVSSVGINGEQLGSILSDTEEKIGDFLNTGGGGFQNFADSMKMSKAQAHETALEFQKLSGREVLIEMVKQMQNAGISAEQMNNAIESMGSDARYLLPSLKDNASGLKTLEHEYKNLATTINDDANKAFEEAARGTNLMTENFMNWMSSAATPAIKAWSALTAEVNKYFKSIDNRNNPSNNIDEDILTIADADKRIKELHKKKKELAASIRVVTYTNNGTASGRYGPQDHDHNQKQLKELANVNRELTTIINTKKKLEDELKTKPNATTTTTTTTETKPKATTTVTSGADAIAAKEKADADLLSMTERTNEQKHQLQLLHATNSLETLDLTQKRELELLRRGISEKMQDTAEFQGLETAMKERHVAEQEAATQQALTTYSKKQKTKNEELLEAQRRHLFNLQSLSHTANDAENELINDSIEKERAQLVSKHEQELFSIRENYDDKLRVTDEYERLISATKAKHAQESVDMGVDYAQQSYDKQAEYYDKVHQITNMAGDSYSSMASQLKGATDEEAKAIKQSFITQQAAAAATATVSYFAAQSAIAAAAIDLAGSYAGIPGGAAMGEAAAATFTATNTAKNTTSLTTTLAGIASTTLGGIASFDVGSEYIANDQLALIHQGERILQPDINGELTRFLALERNKQTGGTTTISAPLTINGNVTDEAWFASNLAKQRSLISGLIKKAESERPRRGR